MRAPRSAISSRSRPLDRPRVALLVYARCHREVLAQALRAQGGFSVFDAGDGSDRNLEQLSRVQAGAALIHLPPARAAAVIRELGRIAPRTRICAVAFDDEEETTLSLLRPEVTALALRTDPLEDLLAALRAALRGEAHYPPRVVADLIRREHERGDSSTSWRPKGVITAREREVLELRERGYSNKEIAVLLSIGLSTVKTHVHRLLAKRTGRRQTAPPPKDGKEGARLDLIERGKASWQE